MEYALLIKTIEDRSERKVFLKNAAASQHAIDILVKADTDVTDAYVGLIGDESPYPETTLYALDKLSGRVSSPSTNWVGHIGLNAKTDEIKLKAIGILGDRPDFDSSAFLSRMAQGTSKPPIQHKVIDTLAKHRSNDAHLAIHRVLDTTKDQLVTLHGRAVLATHSRRPEPQLWNIVQQMTPLKRFEALMGLRVHYNQNGQVDHLIGRSAREFLNETTLLRLTNSPKKRDDLAGIFDEAVKQLPADSPATPSVTDARDAVQTTRKFFRDLAAIKNRPI